MKLHWNQGKFRFDADKILKIIIIIIVYLNLNKLSLLKYLRHINEKKIFLVYHPVNIIFE